MSQAPVLASEYEGAAKAYAEATVELNRQVDEGTSWSGNERNNLFLNLGARKQVKDAGGEGISVPDFADASAVGGFDLPDDSRGLAAIDWDFDGDLDFVTSNRTAPRARVFENRSVDREDSFLAIRPVGDGSHVNRDAIGSRATLTLRLNNGEVASVVRHLHGGQGFLSQSSKWLHFGIPEGAEITSLTVNWDGKVTHSVTGVRAGGFFEVRYGAEAAEEWETPAQERFVSSDGSHPVDPGSGNTETALLQRPVPMPRLPYLDSNGEAAELRIGKPVVLNLWATWCAPCVEELASFSRDADAFRDAGFEVMALCVDVEDADAELMRKAQAILEQVEFPFASGFPAEHTVEMIHLAHNAAFLRPSQLPVPTTLLVDRRGRIRSVSRGGVTPKQLIPVMQAVAGLDEQGWKGFAVPLKGSWLHGADTIYYVGIAKELLERGWIGRAEQFVLDHEPSLKAEGTKFAEVTMVLGTKLLESNELDRGLALLEMAVRAAPELPVARNNLAVALLQHGRVDAALPHLEVAMQGDPTFADPRVNRARIHVANNELRAARLLVDDVLERGYHGGAMRLKAQLHLSQKEIAQVLRTFQAIAKHEPANPTAWLNLGKLQLQLNDAAAARASMQRVLELDPGNPVASEVLAKMSP